MDITHEDYCDCGDAQACAEREAEAHKGLAHADPVWVASISR